MSRNKKIALATTSILLLGLMAFAIIAFSTASDRPGAVAEKKTKAKKVKKKTKPSPPSHGVNPEWFARLTTKFQHHDATVLRVNPKGGCMVIRALYFPVENSWVSLDSDELLKFPPGTPIGLAKESFELPISRSYGKTDKSEVEVANTKWTTCPLQDKPPPDRQVNRNYNPTSPTQCMVTLKFEKQKGHAAMFASMDPKQAELCVAKGKSLDLRGASKRHIITWNSPWAAPKIDEIKGKVEKKESSIDEKSFSHEYPFLTGILWVILIIGLILIAGFIFLAIKFRGVGTAIAAIRIFFNTLRGGGTP